MIIHLDDNFPGFLGGGHSMCPKCYETPKSLVDIGGHKGSMRGPHIRLKDLPMTYITIIFPSTPSRKMIPYEA